jgi:Replication-relaxation
MATSSPTVILAARDIALMRLLSWTPATTSLLLQASVTFEGEPFPDERRLRERLLTLCKAGYLRAWHAASGRGGLQNYYKLSQVGFACVYGPEAELPPRAFFEQVSPSLFEHTFMLAEVIVAIVAACHQKRITIELFYRENEISFSVGKEQVQPDCFLRLKCSERYFNLAFEIDMSMESVDSHAANSIRKKLSLYSSYQDNLLAQWLKHRKQWERPRLRVVFLTRSIERAYHILSLSNELAQNRGRRVIYSATQESFLSENDRLQSPIFLDHLGCWQALVDLHPTAPFTKPPVRLKRMVESPFLV